MGLVQMPKEKQDQEFLAKDKHGISEMLLKKNNF
jgi:hypothetical protein